MSHHPFLERWWHTFPQSRHSKDVCRDVIETYKISGVPSTEVLWGLANHFKNPCDAYFSRLRRWKIEAALSDLLVGVRGDVDSYDKAPRRMAIKDPNYVKDIFINFEPPPRKDVRYSKFVANKLPCNLTSCCHWKFTLNNRRRKKLASQDGRTLIAVDAQAVILRAPRGAHTVEWYANPYS